MTVRQIPPQIPTVLPPPPAEAPSRRELRDRARGYSINRLYVAIAYFGEVVLIAASLVGAWLFAQKYGHGDAGAMEMMMLAPISYAVVELCRVPMAIAFRTQRNVLIKALLFVGIVCAAGVTVKSLSQLGEQMFHPRLIDVVKAGEALQVALREQAGIESRIGATEARLKQRREELDAINERTTGLQTALNSIPPPNCPVLTGINSRGQRYSYRRCDPEDKRLPTVKAGLEKASADRDAARASLEEATAQRAAIDRAPIDQRVSEAKTAHREAVLNSQLHSFAAMVFRKAPTEVTDGEIHAFLFVFVFFPAIFASVAATLLALGAVTRITEPPPPVAMPEQAGAYMLGPLAEHIIRQATEAVHRSAQSDVAEAAGRAGGARIKAVT